MTNLSATFFISQTFALSLTDNTFVIWIHPVVMVETFKVKVYLAVSRHFSAQPFCPVLVLAFAWQLFSSLHLRLAPFLGSLIVLSTAALNCFLAQKSVSRMTRGRSQKRHWSSRKSTDENDHSQTGQGEEIATPPAQHISPRGGRQEDFTEMNPSNTGHGRQNPSVNSKKETRSRGRGMMMMMMRRRTRR